MKKMKEILEKVYKNDELRKSIVPLFIGNPGLGKTKIIEQFAKEKKVQLVELITSQMSPFEVSGICIPDKDTKQMMYYNFDKLENLKDGDILFFDELLNGNPIVLNACLTILEQRRFISGKPLPNIMIIAAANPQGQVPLTPAIKERFIWYNVEFDRAMWINFMKQKYQITPSIGSKLSSLIEKEKFDNNNFYTPRSVDKAVNMVINNVPTPYFTEISLTLSEIVTNQLESSIELTSDKKLEPNESISWLDLIRLKKEIVIADDDADNFIFPDDWCITTDDYSNEIIKKWLIGRQGFNESSDWSVGNYYVFDKKSNRVEGYLRNNPDPKKNFTEITIEQFIKYVLNNKNNV